MPETLDRPSAATDEQAYWLPRRRRSAGAARRLLREFLAGVDGGDQFVWVGELLLGELVANAVEHARVPVDRLILVRFALSDGRLRIEVHDADGERPATSQAVRPPDWDEESGRGLWLVRQLSNGWGCHARADGIGKAVWCTVTPADGSAA